MRTIIAGTRTIKEYESVERAIRLSGFNITEVVSGTAIGVDRQGEIWAQKHDVPIKYFPADWMHEGKRAGYIRNQQMAKYADALIAVWDGKSKGTLHMIKIAKEEGLYTHVHIKGSLEELF